MDCFRLYSSSPDDSLFSSIFIKSSKFSKSFSPIIMFPPLQSISTALGNSFFIVLNTYLALESSMFRVTRWPSPYFCLRYREVPTHLSFPLTITLNRSARISASSMEWVVKMIDFPFLSFSISCQICWRTFGSNPVVGSSKKITLGFPIAEIAKLNLLFIPPLKLETFACFSDLRFTKPKIVSIFSSI